MDLSTYGVAACSTNAVPVVLTKSAYSLGSRKRSKNDSRTARRGVSLIAKNPSRYAVAPSSGRTHLMFSLDCCASATSKSQSMAMYVVPLASPLPML